jgi:uncharacterized protein YlxP (DUF503 family)
MFVLALEAELHVTDAQSLKAKRQVVKALVEGARHRFAVSASEVGHQDLWQRATLGFAVVASSQHQATEIIDSVDRFIWSHPEVSVITTDRRWLE